MSADNRIVRNAAGAKARINLAYEGCYALALPGKRGALKGATVEAVRQQAARYGYT